jgi:hypothetical protein
VVGPVVGPEALRPAPAPGSKRTETVIPGLTRHVPRLKENDVMRLAPAVLLATWLVGLPILWMAVGGGPAPRPGCRDETNAEIDLTFLRLLREKGVQEQLGLSAGQKVEIGRRLALTLDNDQEDLIHMILGQYHADRGRLRELEDPDFEDDGEGPQYERPRLMAMAEEFGGRAAALVDRILAPEQRTALGARRPTDPEVLVKSLTTLQRDSMSGINAALTPSQRDRLKQLAVDAEGPLSAVRPEVAARLKLSREQQTRVRAIWDAARDDLNRLRGPSPFSPSPAYRDGDDLEVRMRPRLSTIRKESARILANAGERISKVLLKK